MVKLLTIHLPQDLDVVARLLNLIGQAFPGARVRAGDNDADLVVYLLDPDSDYDGEDE